jgi:hypothetical protein
MPRVFSESSARHGIWSVLDISWRLGFAENGVASKPEWEHLRREVEQALNTLLHLLDRLELWSRVDPTMPIRNAADDFNALLTMAKEVFPDSGIIRTLQPLDPDDHLITLITRVASLRGAINAGR